jgi:predicted RNA polymerase sigma factor
VEQQINTFPERSEGSGGRADLQPGLRRRGGRHPAGRGRALSVSGVRRFGDFAAAEDAVQESLPAAALHWPVDGVPDNPRGWLVQTAARRMTDQFRSEQARHRREDTAASLEPPPVGDDRAPRLRSVLRVLYLLFNEGYTSSVGHELHRGELSGEAIRLARAVHAVLPDDGEVAGLLALNRAVAVAMVHGPRAGLTLLDAVAERLDGHYRLDAVRAHLREMAGDVEAAVEHYRAAAARTASTPEWNYLVTQAARLGTP